MKLPAYEDLSKEQDLIYDLDLDGRYLVSGPPGTGKSIMALYRAQMLTHDDRKPALLMYSKVLQQYTEQAADEVDVAGYVTTFHKWFWAFWRKEYRTVVPTLASSSYDPDWAEIAKEFLAKPPKKSSLVDLIVDEGQDMALGFYRATRHIAENMTVFADENQQLFDNNMTLEEIERAIGADEHLTLNRNYRNTAEIAAVAAKFYTGTPTGIPDTPERHGDKPTLRRYSNTADFLDFVARYATAHTNLSIGIACPNQKLQRKLHDDLTSRKLPIPVQQYLSKDKNHKVLDFDQPAVTLLYYTSLKGLEFDTLFVPEIQQWARDPSSAASRMLFYVIMARARDELHLSWSGQQQVPEIVSGLDGLVQRI